MKTMKISSSQSFESVCAEIKDLEYQLELMGESLRVMEEDLDQLDSNDPGRTDTLKLLMTSKFDYAKQYAGIALTKARFGIVGHSWYNDDKDDHGQ